MVQFGPLKFCRALSVSECGMKKVTYSRVSLHEASTENAHKQRPDCYLV